MTDKERVIIVGGGPVGVVGAVALAQKNIPVTLVEAHDFPPKDPRAATLHPPTLQMLEQLGMGDEIIANGLHAPEFQFRDRRSGESVAIFDLTLLRDKTPHPYCIQYEQWKTAQLGYTMLKNYGHVDVRMGTSAVGLSQSEEGVTLITETRDGVREEHSGSYLIGCDGGRSFVRKSLDIDFVGFTYPERFLVMAMQHDFGADGRYVFRNYVMDPVEWCAVFKVPGEDSKGLWRTLFPTKETESDEQVLSAESVDRRLGGLEPSLGFADTEHRNLYMVHQRVAETFNKGRCFLAGDAAHVNNPLGGLGLNSGIHDVMNITDKIHQVLNGEIPVSELDRYDRQRRSLAHEFIQAQTIANKKRLEATDEDVRQKNMDELRQMAANPEKARAWLLRTSLLESVAKSETIE
ncbi:MAG: FAD-dependent oxidoreductase [Methyloligellaceae bacterium]